jgi:hypothetical protein
LSGGCAIWCSHTATPGVVVQRIVDLGFVVHKVHVFCSLHDWVPARVGRFS